MKWTLGKTAIWMMLTVAVATMAYATAQEPQLPEGDGKKILQADCTACHGLEDVVNSHMDKKGWEDLVQSMIGNGAAVDEKDFPVLVSYLVKNYGPAAEGGQQAAPAAAASGDGKSILENSCTSCHDLDLVQDQRLSKGEWQDLVKSMIGKGASVEDKDMPVLVDYLAKTYGK